MYVEAVTYTVFVLTKKTVVRVVTIVIITVIMSVIVLLLVPFGSKKLNFKAVFYYVCHNSPEDSSSVASVSGLVHSYGGAGYIVSCGGKNFVTVSCYYTESDAVTVCNSLKKKGLDCAVVKAEVDGKDIKGGAVRQAAKYEGNLNTMLSLSKLCYNLANSLDRYEVNQTGAKSMLAEVEKSIDGLIAQNAGNCFAEELNNLKAECDDVSYGYVFAYDVRRLQIAVCDSIVNVNIY